MAKDKDKKDAPADDEAPKGGKKKLLIIGLVAVLALGAAAYFFVFSGGGAEAEPAPEAGAVVLTVDPVAINLAGGSYLKLGLALQFSLAYDENAGGHEGGDPDGSKALDIAIAQFSGAALTDVQTNREALKAALQEAIVKAYHGDVYSIYYTEYVTQ
jgi:flagellar FliL protein